MEGRKKGKDRGRCFEFRSALTDRKLGVLPFKSFSLSLFLSYTLSLLCMYCMSVCDSMCACLIALTDEKVVGSPYFNNGLLIETE